MWHEWRTGERVEGPCRRPVATTADWGGALYVKGGAIIPTWPVKQHLDKGWNEEVVFEVWPSAEGRATLYEDDGTSLGYRKGEFAVTPLTLERTADGMRFSVGVRKGAFVGMPAARRMRVRIHSGRDVRDVDLGLVGAEGKSLSL